MSIKKPAFTKGEYMRSRVVIYGAGNAATEAINFIAFAYDAFEIVSVVDTDQQKHGIEFMGHTIESPENITNIRYDFIFIASQYYYDIYNYLMTLGVSEDVVRTFSKEVLEGKYSKEHHYEFKNYDGFIGRELERSGQGFFIVSLPKSGTTFTRHNAIKISNKAFPRAVYHPNHKELKHSGLMDQVNGICTIGAFTSETIVDIQSLKSDIDDASIIATHMPANFHNLQALKEGGVERVTVLIRDPKDALVSWIHHLEKDIDFWIKDIQKFYYIPDEYKQWTIEDKIAFQVRTYFPLCVNWIEAWLYEAVKQDDIDIRIVFFEQLKNNPYQYFTDLFDYHGVEDYSLELLSGNKQGKMHFRRGISGSWKDEVPGYLHQTLFDIEAERLERALASLLEADSLYKQLVSSNLPDESAKDLIHSLLLKHPCSNLLKSTIIKYGERLLLEKDFQVMLSELKTSSIFTIQSSITNLFE